MARRRIATTTQTPLMGQSAKKPDIKVAFWGKKNPVKQAREDPNFTIGDKIPSAAKREKEIEDLWKQQ